MKVVAITGGGQGIGRATAFHFAKAGYAISIADADGAAGREAAKILRETGTPAFFLRTDISKEKDVAAWIQCTVRELGCPDVLINNAGFSRNAPFLKLKPKDFDAVIATNLRGAFLCGQAVARRMAARKKGGSIVNIASTRAFMSEADTEAYTASKGGIVALTHGMAMSLASYRIRVNCVSPGWIEVRDWKLCSRARTPVHSKTDREQHPVGRVGRPEDIAEACLYLADHAGFVTGQNLTVDGGMTIKMIYEE